MKGNKRKLEKGFTLIELLVVIAIIAILSVVVILTLNPAELLRQSRDSNRISDMSVTKSAIAFYLASVTTPNLASSSGAYAKCYVGDTIGTSSCATWFGATFAAGSVVSGTSKAVDSTGWLPINFNAITAGGSPLSNLPTDPLFGSSGGVYFYSYVATSTYTFKLDAHIESQKYSNGQSNDVVSTDGGIDPQSYEQGTNLAL